MTYICVVFDLFLCHLVTDAVRGLCVEEQGTGWEGAVHATAAQTLRATALAPLCRNRTIETHTGSRMAGRVGRYMGW